MWDLMITGLSTPPQILKIANEEWKFRTRPTRKMGGKPLCRSAIYQIFTKPFYSGRFEYPNRSGHWYKGKHEPMVTEAEFDRVQALLGRKGNPRPQTLRTFAFTGLIRCGECGGMVTAEEKHQLICERCRFKFAYRSKNSCPRCQVPIGKMAKPQFLHYTYYHCTKSNHRSCTQKSVSVTELEKNIDAYLKRIQISERFKAWAVKYLRELYAREAAARNDMIQAQQKAHVECLLRIDALVKLNTSPQNATGDLLSQDEYSRQRMDLLKEKASLEELMQDAGHRVVKWLDLAEKTFEFACVARERFAKGDPITKKEILSAIGSNLILKDKTLFVEAKKPFFILETSLPADTDEVRALEHENIKAPQQQEGGSASPCLRGLGDLHDIRTLNASLGRQYMKLVKEVYTYFKNRSACPCEECQAGLSSGEVSLARWKRKPRWNSLPSPARKCLLK